ncbi:methyltransferase domain-containing protein [Acinetobacter baumannii]|nr:methyltransferase domain-containing protein [Acinetobacter baumannii]
MNAPNFFTENATFVKEIISSLKNSNVRKRSDSLGRYYTPKHISDLLAKSLGKIENAKILDLGCGTGSLIESVLEISNDSRFFGVDIDSVAINILKEKNLFNLTIIKNDILNLNLESNSFDVSISNPPYTYYKLEDNFDHTFFSEAKFLKSYKIPSPFIFLDKMIKATKKNGTIGIILPNGILTNNKWRLIRNNLLKNLTIIEIIELPAHTFSETETVAHIVIMKNFKSISNYNIKMKKIFKNGFIQEYDNSASDLENKKWIIDEKDFNSDKLSNHVEKLQRGSVNSKEIKDNNLNVFHTKDFIKNDIKVPKSFIVKVREKGVFAKSGDILISRVGRNHFEKIAVVENNYIEISDSIILIRPKENSKDFLINFLTSQNGKNRLKNCASGTSAKFLTYENILNLKVN